MQEDISHHEILNLSNQTFLLGAEGGTKRKLHFSV